MAAISTYSFSAYKILHKPQGYLSSVHFRPRQSHKDNGWSAGKNSTPHQPDLGALICAHNKIIVISLPVPNRLTSRHQGYNRLKKCFPTPIKTLTNINSESFDFQLIFTFSNQESIIAPPILNQFSNGHQGCNQQTKHLLMYIKTPSNIDSEIYDFRPIFIIVPPAHFLSFCWAFLGFKCIYWLQCIIIHTWNQSIWTFSTYLLAMQTKGWAMLEPGISKLVVAREFLVMNKEIFRNGKGNIPVILIESWWWAILIRSVDHLWKWLCNMHWKQGPFFVG